MLYNYSRKNETMKKTENNEGNKTMEELKEIRSELVIDRYNSYSAGDFPGSKAWQITQGLQAKLDEFDAEHPEIIAEKTAAIAAENKKIADAAGWI